MGSIVFPIISLLAVISGAIVFTKQKVTLVPMFTRVFTALFTWKTFFWGANSVFMVVSMQHASYLFDGFNAPGTTLPLGIALVGVLDLAVILFTQALLVANERGEYGRAWAIIGYIALCALLSTIGNVVHNLHFMDASKFTGVPHWLQVALPWIVSTPPLLIVAFSVVAELLVHTNVFRNMDIAEYQEQEDKKLAFKQVQLSSRQKQAELNTLLLEVIALEKHNKKQRKSKHLSVNNQPVNNQQVTVTPMPVNRLPESTEESKQSGGDELVTDPHVLTPKHLGVNSKHGNVLLLTDKLNNDTEQGKAEQVKSLLAQYPDMPQSEIAKRAGVSRGYVSQINKKTQVVNE